MSSIIKVGKVQSSTGQDAIDIANDGTITANGAIDSLKTDTISEKTSANGVSIDGLKVKDYSLMYGSNIGLTVDSNGYVLTPNQIISSYKLQHNNCGSGITITGSTSSTPLVNRGNCFDNSNGKFTAPVAGAYLFALNIGLGSASNGSTWYGFVTHKNGSIIGHTQYEHINTVHDNQATHIICIDLSASDYVEIKSDMNGTIHLFIHYLAYLMG